MLAFQVIQSTNDIMSHRCAYRCIEKFIEISEDAGLTRTGLNNPRAMEADLLRLNFSFPK